MRATKAPSKMEIGRRPDRRTEVSELAHIDIVNNRGSLKMGFFAFRQKKQDSPFKPKVEIPFPVVAGEVEYITIEAKHRCRGGCFHRALNFLDSLGKRIFYGGHS